jgi:tetratricopeptide (TPR) repeat protein
MTQASAVEARMVCKSVARQASALLEASPEAPNRYAVLAVLFQCQKRLLWLERTERNRKALIETCTSLSKAPDEYAELRLEADMLLSERDLAEAEATVVERAEALEKTLSKYRGTPAEWKSLIIGGMVATKLQEFDLEKKISDTMAERFGGDHEFIELWREKNRGRIDAVFSGRYKTPDGRTVVFPDDRLGHQYLAYFWSQNTPDIDKHLIAVKEVQSRSPGAVEVYSINLDELPDAGEKRLRSLGLDWPALYLPGGRQSSTYQAYARRDPDAVFVNAQGHVLLVAVPKGQRAIAGRGLREGALGGWTSISGIESRLDDPRFLAQLQYLFNGDFLAGSVAWQVTSGEESSSPPQIASELKAIQSCLVTPPFRYRLTQKESLANYRRAEELCTAAIKNHPKVPDLWAVCNRRIIALLGMWRLGRDVKYLEEAVKEAEIVLGMKLPPGADVVARFCLAKQALRSGGDPEVILADLIEQAGGDKAPASALAAAAILAIEGNARTAHEKYRPLLLDIKGDGEPALWPVYAFLRDRHHRYRNFWASPGGCGHDTREGIYEYRNMVSGLAVPEDRSRRLDVELKQIDGGRIKIPGVATGEPLGVIFMEPPPTAPAQSNLMQQVKGFAGTYQKQGVKTVVVFLSEDANIVKPLIQNNEAGFLSGMLPDGLKNPLVQKLGILSADRVANPFLLRPDGTIAWSISGLQYRYYRGRGLVHPITMAIGPNIDRIRFGPAFEALERGEFKKALQLFDGYTPLHWWTADRLHGRALAYMGLKDWNAALAQIDAALKERLAKHRSSRCKCHGVVEMYLAKATILEKLGRGQDAAEQRRLAAGETLPHVKGNREASQGVPVGVYYDWLKRIRLKLEERGK